MSQNVLTAGASRVEHETVEPAAGADGTLAGLPVVWVAWERQRRTTELAAALGVPLERFLYRGPGPLRYPVLAVRTWACLRRRRPRTLIVQNPSLLLAVLGVWARALLGIRLVVDRHTNFALNQPASLRKSVFTAISAFTLRHADLTVVTNAALAGIVADHGGRGRVLPDRLPTLEPVGSYPLAGRRNVCFICTYAQDEPYAEVLRAAGTLPPDVHLYVTGNPERGRWTPELAAIRAEAANVTLTGFLPDDRYFALLRGCDVVVDLTTFDHCLVCGSYEAIAAGRTLVLSDKQANRELFGDLPVYVEPDAASIAAGLARALAEAPERSARVRAFAPVFARDWQAALENLSDEIRGL